MSNVTRIFIFHRSKRTLAHLIILLTLTIPAYIAAQEQIGVPKLEFKTVVGESPDAVFPEIDGVLHGESSPSGSTRFLYGVPVTEWRQGQQTHLKIGTTEVASNRIEAVKKELLGLKPLKKSFQA